MIKQLINLSFFLLILSPFSGNSQHLKLPKRNVNSLTGSAFVAIISDSLLSITDREQFMIKEVVQGNVPNFYRNFLPITDTTTIDGKQYIITYFVAPDYLIIGSDQDYFYSPLTASAAQKIANQLNCSLPTRKMSDQIYQSAEYKLIPEPIPPSIKMTTVPVFVDHNKLVEQQRLKIGVKQGSLVAGNKKDVVISNKITATDESLRVVIYGWHKPDGKAIQPMYNGHKYDWVDYSHGIRLIQNQIYLNGRKTTVKEILKSKSLNVLLSDEGPIYRPRYQ